MKQLKLEETPGPEEDCPVCGGWNVPSKYRPYCSAGCAAEAMGKSIETTVAGQMSSEDWGQFRHTRR
jgi:endogenous inhibitor of DNA gyrase (YacG/DUF329 family)